MEFINAVVLIVAGILAVSGLIVAKQPNAKELIDKLVPYQAFIGVGLLALGVLSLLRWLGNHLPTMLSFAPVFGMTIVSMIVTSIVLGFLLGMPQIAKWLPAGSAASNKGMTASSKLAPYQVILGFLAIGTGLLMLLYQFHILKLVW